MKLTRLRIENFRSFHDETIDLDDYTCFVGANGAGKSAVLTALNVFFRNNAAAATNVLALADEDFHHKNTSSPIKISVTFGDLEPEAQERFKHYFRQGELTLFAKAIWDESTRSAPVVQGGSRMVMPEFAPWFELLDSGTANELKAAYGELRGAFTELPPPGSKAAMESALRAFEEAHEEKCRLLDDPAQLYGWTKGVNRLAEFVQWVYVPAVKDAAGEQDEGAKTALGQLLDRTIRQRIKFDEQLDALKRKLEEDYRQILAAEGGALTDLERSLAARLQQWASPAASLALRWHYDPNKSIVVNAPIARAAIGEDRFEGEVARLGHGMQRAFIVSLLEELARVGGQNEPRLILGIEEPELYQHPPQARHMAHVLHGMTTQADAPCQILVTTHSPFFVSARGFEAVRSVQKATAESRTHVRGATYSALEGRLARALNEKPGSPSALMARVAQILQPSQRELFFSRVPVLVEGIEDVAFIATHLELTDRWTEFRRLGCHFVVCDGKSQMSRPLAIARELRLPAFVVFDADADERDAEKRAQHSRDNSCLLALCGSPDADPLPSTSHWHPSGIMWQSTIAKAVRDDLGPDRWDAAENSARTAAGWTEGVRRKNALLIAATLEQLDAAGVRSTVLTRTCDALLAFASTPPSEDAPAAEDPT